MTEHSIQQQVPYNVLLIGDNCRDIYQYGTIDRLSPEAPVPVFVPSYKEEKEGMVSNVRANLVALGCKVNLLSGQTSSKTRLIDSRSKQQIVRIDNDVISDPILFETKIPNVYDAIVISDYAKGTVTYELIEEILKEANCPVFIDTKLTDLKRLEGAWVKINELEYSKIKSECSRLIVTRGSNGSEVVAQGIHRPACKVEVVDVTGAGDTFLSALAYKYIETSNIETAIDFANKAASITVQHVGCYAPLLEEIQ